MEEEKKEVKTRIVKGKQGFGYKYTELAQINEYLEGNNMSYYQYVDRIDNDDYIMTVPIIDNKELPPRRGVKIVDATLQGIKNPAQEQGSATTYARRYSLLMAFGLATEDDDARALSREKKPNKEVTYGVDDEVPDMMIQEGQKQIIMGSLSPDSLSKQLEKFKVETIDELTWKQAYEIETAIEKARKEKQSK